ncbi:MAG TPA: hypothetical protein VFX61_10505 [Micromonosporaceae bacterium]|nr:hypothetical protein [Micromonosporaceae bacterium]
MSTGLAVICDKEVFGLTATADDVSTRRLRAWMHAYLMHLGVDPDRLGAVLDVAAVGIVNSAWRNSVVENWHAGRGPLSDADMLVINSHSTWRVRQLAHRWRRDLGLRYDTPAIAIDDSAGDFDWLGSRLYAWFASPHRKLPTGQVLGGLAGDDLAEYAQHAAGVLGGLLAQADTLGVAGSLWRAALHGGLACRHWWDTPTWPQLVNDCVGAAFDGDHEYWSRYGHQLRDLPAAPVQIATPEAMRSILLRRPWTLQAASADWLIRLGIGFFQPAMTTPTNLPDLDGSNVL